MSIDPLSLTFSALADPVRRQILKRLSLGDATVNELASPHEMSLPAISRHIKVLENAGLLSKTRHAQQRPCHLEVAPLHHAQEWMEQYKAFWDDRFDRLDDYLKTLQNPKS